MAKTNKTQKQIREEKELAALTQRITDIYSGAGGRKWDEESECPSPEELSLVIPAIRSVFDPDEQKPYLWDPHCIREFIDPSGIAKMLYQSGIRAL